MRTRRCIDSWMTRRSLHSKGTVIPLTKKPNVAVIYHMFPHYRAPVMRELTKSKHFNFKFYGSKYSVEGIEAFQGDQIAPVHHLKFSYWRGLGWISGAVRQAAASEVDAVILIGNPNYISTWCAAAAARLRGKSVLLWAHGWLKRERWPKRWLRNLYFRLAHAVLVYDDRASILAEEAGFPAARVHAIYNSLDWDAAETHYHALGRVDPEALRAKLGLPTDRPVIICTARLTPQCRFDLLLDAVALLQTQGMPTTVVLVGDGPERPRLANQAESLGIDLRLMGAIYDEAIIARLLYSSDMTVSPGKVGLTAIHSLTYGTPVVTHDERDAQMPEVEAVEEGLSGNFFKRDDHHDLARAVMDRLNDSRGRNEIRRSCRAIVSARYTPSSQRARIEKALMEVMGALR